MEIQTDVLIIGTGVAGLYSAINLKEDVKILMVTKTTLTECNSYLAQGGISMALDANDVPSFFEDTMIAGNRKNDPKAVEILCNESTENIIQLVEMGTPFDKKEDALCYTREGAHSKHRIVYCKDSTGKYVVDTLLQKIKAKPNVSLMEYSEVIDIITHEDTCIGAIMIQNGKQINVFAKTVILATGGIGGLFKNSTNQRTLTGDALFIALKHHIELKDLHYIQFHPTALYEKNSAGRRFLISESLRGEGGRLYNTNGERFVDELLPRDVVSQGIYKEMERSGVPYVYLDVSHLSSAFVKNRFPKIYKECLQRGIDITKNKIPVSPAQHYFMGGIQVDGFSRTSMKNLYAVGETSCTGVHGSNRLASNSLLEALVFPKRAAHWINAQIDYIPLQVTQVPILASSLESIEAYQRKIVIDALIRRSDVLNDELFRDRQDTIKCSTGGYALV